jgi:hypothetical protein
MFVKNNITFEKKSRHGHWTCDQWTQIKRYILLKI